MVSEEGIEECVKSPAKLFYFNLWGSIFDWYLDELLETLPTGEHGESLSDNPGNGFDVLGYIIPEVRLQSFVRDAIEETRGQFEKGEVQFENGSVPVEFKGIPDDIKFECLIDWRCVEDINKQPGYVVSLEGFRNIEAKDATEIKKPKTKEEVKAFNRKNRQFIAAVVNMDDSQLTPMERAIKTFAGDFLRMDEYYHVEGFMNGRGYPMMENLLPGYLIKPWMLKMSNELEVSQEDFYKTLNQRGGYKDGANLSFMATTFDYQEVKRWNEMNGFQSHISEETLKNAV